MWYWVIDGYLKLELMRSTIIGICFFSVLLKEELLNNSRKIDFWHERKLIKKKSLFIKKYVAIHDLKYSCMYNIFKIQKV